MIFFYNILTFLYLPFALAKLFYKKSLSRNEFYRIKERFGSHHSSKIDLNKEIIWVHAVSVGEVNTSTNLIKKLQKTFPNKKILVTTTTDTGSKRLTSIFEDQIYHQYLPFDVVFFVNKFLNYWNPNCLILIETEIWPNFIDKCFSKKIPVILLNGRLSNKSFARYKKVKNFSLRIFSKIDIVISQTANDKNNFVKIGVNPNNIYVDSSLKFDALDTDLPKPTFTYDERLLAGKKIITCASTHNKEEEILLKSFKMLNKDWTHLVLVPRHPHRASQIEEILKKENMDFSILKKGEKCELNLQKQITIVNEIGHLNFLFSISDLAFIGGTLIDHGGQNFLEPLKYGIPISSGRSVFNFQQIAMELNQFEILKYGNSAKEISAIWNKELSEDNFDRINKKSSEYLSSQKGSLERSLEKIKEYI